MNQLPDPTRQRVLEALRFGPRTVEFLAGTVGITRNGVRAHLTSLARAGLVARSGVVRAETPGKPAQLFALTPRAEAEFSTAYPAVLAALVRAMSRRLPDADVDSIFQDAGQQLAGPAPAPAATLSANTARQLLGSLGAAVTVATNASGTTTVSGAACPLADAVRVCPESCEMVRAMLARATGVSVVTRCQHGAAPRCNFEVG